MMLTITFFEEYQYNLVKEFFQSEDYTQFNDEKVVLTDEQNKLTISVELFNFLKELIDELDDNFMYYSTE